MNKVHLGMTQAEVVKILGQPASTAESKDGTITLYYLLREASPLWAGNIGSMNARYSVKLLSGKVDSYGRDGGASSP